MHHLLRTKVSSIMRNTASYKVVPDNCSSTFTLPTPGRRLSVVLKHKQVRCGLPKLSGGQAFSVHAAETKSQHRSKTEEGLPV